MRMKKLYGSWGHHKSKGYMHVGIPEGEEEGKENESLVRAIMAENLSSLGQEMGFQMLEAKRIPNRLN